MSKAEDKRIDELFQFVENELSFREACNVIDFISFMLNELTCAKMLKVSELIGMMGVEDNE